LLLFLFHQFDTDLHGFLALIWVTDHYQPKTAPSWLMVLFTDVYIWAWKSQV